MLGIDSSEKDTTSATREKRHWETKQKHEVRTSKFRQFDIRHLHSLQSRASKNPMKLTASTW